MEAEEDELHNEEGGQWRSVAKESDGWIGNINWWEVEGASLTSNGAASDGGEDATSEERNTEAANAARGEGEDWDGDAWDEDAEHQEAGDDEENQVDGCVVFVRRGPASEHGISCSLIGRKSCCVIRRALSAKVIEGNVGRICVISGSKGYTELVKYVNHIAKAR